MEETNAEGSKVARARYRKDRQGENLRQRGREREREKSHGPASMFATTVNIGINLNSDVRNQGVDDFETATRAHEGPKREWESSRGWQRRREEEAKAYNVKLEESNRSLLIFGPFY